MDKKLIAAFIVVSLLVTLFSGCLGEDTEEPNDKPIIAISYPTNSMKVSSLVMISGTSNDPDGDDDLIRVEVKIDDGVWETADGTTKWSYDWSTYEYEDGSCTINA
ncbi:MAG: hypothetical protein KAU84_01080, partial [Thermoplasmatales archaeon]|nr:hypothetical protein [Thermoplasmatales archaeon]